MHPFDDLPHDVNRREFLGSSARNAAGMAAGMVGLGGAAASASVQNGTSGDRVRVGVIGVRAHGRSLAVTLAGFPDVEIAAVCDVDESLLPQASEAVAEIQTRTPKAERDFRRLLDDPKIDAVVIAAPDHWHAKMAVLACDAGKDVYVEAPASHNVIEGFLTTAAARRHGRVVQTGLQQRSGPHFQSAVEFVRTGKLGRVHLARAWTAHLRKPIGFKRSIDAPTSVDYDMWLGPAPARSFSPNRFHHNWRWFWDYGGGELAAWGVHLLDVARWGLGVELPNRISATGGKFHFNDEQETPDTLTVNFEFPSRSGKPGGAIIWEHRMWTRRGIEGRNAAVAFYGDNGTLIVDRGGWKVYDRKETLTADGGDHTPDHLRNFIDCVKTRERPAADIEIGHISSTLCHLGNIAHRLGREVVFDPGAMSFGNDAEAVALLGREYRKVWAL